MFICCCWGASGGSIGWTPSTPCRVFAPVPAPPFSQPHHLPIPSTPPNSFPAAFFTPTSMLCSAENTYHPERISLARYCSWQTSTVAPRVRPRVGTESGHPDPTRLCVALNFGRCGAMWFMLINIERARALVGDLTTLSTPFSFFLFSPPPPRRAMPHSPRSLSTSHTRPFFALTVLVRLCW